jgi:hypothetical protein
VECGRGSDTCTRGQGFTEKPWGTKAHELCFPIRDLTHQHWAMIKRHAEAHLQDSTRHLTQVALPNEDAFGDDNDASSYPHAHLIVYWYVSELFNWKKKQNSHSLTRRNNCPGWCTCVGVGLGGSKLVKTVSELGGLVTRPGKWTCY